EALPRQVEVSAAEVAVRRRLPVDGSREVEAVDDGRRPQVEVLADESLDLVLVDGRRPERLDGYRRWVRDADGVRHLHLKPLRETSGDDVLGNVTRGVRPGAVDLRRVLAAEGAATVPR